MYVCVHIHTSTCLITHVEIKKKKPSGIDSLLLPVGPELKFNLAD